MWEHLGSNSVSDRLIKTVCQLLVLAFRQPCWSARSVEDVEANGYEIKPGADLERADLLYETI
jgi:hypothetical protein